MNRRLMSLLLAIVILAAAVPASVISYADEAMPIEHVFVNYEGLKVTEMFSDDSTGIGASYLAPGSKVKVVGANYSLMGTRSLAINKCDMRWWTINANDQEYYIDLTVKANEDFNNTLALSFSSRQPTVGASVSASYTPFKITKQDGKSVVLDSEGNIALEMDPSVRYSIRCVFKRGSDKYDILINNVAVSKECNLSAPVYTIDYMAIDVNPLPNDNSGNTTETDLKEPYILIDNPSVITKGRYYPQRFSAQETGATPLVKIPDDVSTKDIRVFINTTEIIMADAPIERSGTVYIDIEQILRCIGATFKEDKSNRTYNISNDKVDISGTLGSKSVKINGETYKLNASPEKISGTIMVSPDFICQAFNAKVWWDEAGKLLIFSTGKYKNDDILRNIGGKFFMNGEPYYEISFNKFDLFYQVMASYEDSNEFPSEEYTVSAAEAALKQLHDLGFRSIRVFMYSGVYQDLMYNEAHQETYFKAMDQVFDLCDKYDIKVVVCLGLIETYLLKNDYVEGQGWITGTETVNELVINSQSESRKNLNEYIKKFITRYKDRKSVLMWEIRNEGNLEADIGAAVNKVTYSLIQLAKFYGDCADEIRKYDKEHMITSGDSVLRSSQWNLLADVMSGNELRWKTDTLQERLKALSLLNEKLDVISAHAYGLGISANSQYMSENGEISNCTFELYVKEAARLGKLFYNGETNAEKMLDSETFYEDTESYLNAMIEAGVQLSHWWTFRSDRQGFNDGYLWRVDSGELLELIINSNKKLKLRYVVNKAADDNITDAWADPAYEVFDSKKVSDGKEFVKKSSFKSQIIRMIILGVIVLAVCGVGVFVLTREKIKKKRKDDFV